MNQLLKISEFARLSGITRKNLIFYDEIGLLSPERTADNGYRYYSYRQLETVSVISALQEVGMPLKQIKLYLDQRTPEKLYELFTQQREQVTQKINKLQSIQRMIDMRLDITSQAKNVDSSKLLLMECGEEALIVSQEVARSTEEAVQKTTDAFYELCDRERITYGYPLGTIISHANLLAGNWSLPSRFFFKFTSDKKGLSQICKPSGLYLIGFEEVASYDSPTAFYRRICEYMADADLAFCGNSYEEYLLDEVAVKEPGNFLMKISVQVSKNP